MNNQQKWKFLTILLSVMLCMALAAAGISEGEVSANPTDVTTSEQAYSTTAPVATETPAPVDVTTSEQAYTPTVAPVVTQAPAPVVPEAPAVVPYVQPAAPVQQISTPEGISAVSLNGGVNIVSISADAVVDGELVIPAAVNGAPVKYLYSSVFDAVKDKMTTVTIPASVEFIWNDAFDDCTVLKTIHFLGNEAQCAKLFQNVALPEGCVVDFVE